MSFKCFLNNLKYLFRYNIKEINKKSEFANNHVHYLRYATKEDNNIFIPKILNKTETIKYLTKNQKSLARFGDGEFALMNNAKNAISQDCNENLAKRLEEILSSNNAKIEIAIPYSATHYLEKADEERDFILNFYGKYNEYIFKHLHKNKVYLDSYCTIFPTQEEFELWKEVWNERDVTIICGDRVFKNIHNNIFDNAKSIEYQYAPTVNAFEQYDKILEKAKEINKNRLVIIILGPSATVLAYDLGNIGYQALDLGHIAKSYNAFYNNMEMSRKNISKFFGRD